MQQASSLASQHFSFAVHNKGVGLVIADHMYVPGAALINVVGVVLLPCRLFTTYIIEVHT